MQRADTMSEQMQKFYNDAGEEVDIVNNEELAKLILEITKDKSVLSMLFGTDLEVEVTPKILAASFYEYSVILAIKSIINTAFLIIINRWKQTFEDDEWANESRHIETFKNSRYSKIFQSALNYEEVTLDLQVFSIIELWVSLKTSRDVIKERFSGIFDTGKHGDSIGITLQEALDVAKRATFKGKSGTEGKYSKRNCNILCYKLMKAFPVFGKVTFVYPKGGDYSNDEDFIIKYDKISLYPNKNSKFGKTIVTLDQLYSMKGTPLDWESSVLSPHMLVGIVGYGGKIQKIYRSFDGESEAYVEVKEEVVPKQDGEEDPKERETATELKKFLCFNYKNLRECALVISDALRNSDDKKEKLFDECVRKFPQIVAGISSADSENIYWDNLITLMLVEMGPSDFLELILDDDRMFEEIIENVGWRCIGSQEADNIYESYKKDLSALKKQYARNSKLLKPQNKSLRVFYAVKAMGFMDVEGEDFNPFEESLSTKYDNMLGCLTTLRKFVETRGVVNGSEFADCAKQLKEIFRNIFIFLQFFYNGLDAYAVQKQKCLDVEDSHERHKMCLRQFVKSASAVYQQIKDLPLTEVYEGFLKLCMEYNSDGKNGFNVSAKATRLKYLITRNYICDVEKLKYFATINTVRGETTIFHMLDNVLEYCYDPKFLEWLTYFQDFFLFLIYNDDYYERGLFNTIGRALKDKDCDPVYPYIVSYYKENIDRDNLKKCAYRVPVPVNDFESDEHDRGFVVTLLTEDHYPPNTYFCIPLRYGSTDRWWINPFMIPKFVVKRIRDNSGF